MKNALRTIIGLLFFIGFSYTSFSQQIIDTTRIYGVTIDDASGFDTSCVALKNHCKKMTVRMAFDGYTPASYYVEAIDSIHNAAFIMGQALDSYFVSNYTVPEYHNRTVDYVNTFNTEIDLWEIGNEVNGEWLGDVDSVLAKIGTAFNVVKSYEKKTALTLFMNPDCYSDPHHEMFYWVNNYLPDSIKLGVDYLLVSYYEDSCNGFQPDWQHIFDTLHIIFPNSKLGMGECGTDVEEHRDLYITKYYTMNITTPGYIGGYFWWTYKEDCVPFTNNHWNTLNNAICNPTAGINTNMDQKVTLENFPNPFIRTTEIRFTLAKKEIVNLIISDYMGRPLKQLITNKEVEQGEHSISFNTDLPSGVYICKLVTPSSIINKKMVIAQ
jgi:hypothetical protein